MGENRFATQPARKLQRTPIVCVADIGGTEPLNPPSTFDFYHRPPPSPVNRRVLQVK